MKTGTITILLTTLLALGVAGTARAADKPEPFFEAAGTESHLLGWSADGNVVALLDYDHQGEATHLADLRFVDLRSDKQLEGRRWQWDEETSKGAVFAGVLNDATRLARKRGFRPPESDTLRKFGDEVPFVPLVSFEKGKAIRLLLRQDGEGKTIYQRDLSDESEFDRSESFRVKGFLQGPNPHRIAVVVERVARSADGSLKSSCLMVGAGVGRLF